MDTPLRKNEPAVDSAVFDQTWWLPLSALAAPLLLWPVEAILPFPFLIEEGVKFYWALNLRRVPVKAAYVTAAVTGGLFALSETFLYLLNASLLGSGGFLWWRLMLTLPMHLLTILGMTKMGRGGGYWPVVGFTWAVLIHFWFNRVVGGF